MSGGAQVWDLTGFFPSFAGPQMLAFQERLQADLYALGQRASAAGPPGDGLGGEAAARWESIVLALEELEARLGHLTAYAECLGAAEADNEAFRRQEALLARLGAEVEKVEVDLLAALKAASEEDFAAFAGREKLRGAAHHLRRLRRRALHTMSRDQERLAAELAVDGLHAWGRLYNTLSGRLDFEMRWPDGRLQRVPMAQWRALMGSADRRVGRAAFEGGNREWARIGDACAAALNAIAGSRLTLNRYRGHGHYLEPALYQSQVERETLEAMYAAIHAHLQLPRRIFQAKAAALGRTGVWWFEREAPLEEPAAGQAGELAWEEARSMVGRAFRSMYPALADYFEQVLARRWVESQKRPGKRPGAFCTGSPLTGEQRIYLSFGGTLRDVSTLAHETGHAWHGWLLRDLRPMARRYPMTLAETASVFAEALLAAGAAADPGLPAAQRLAFLDAELGDAAIMLLDITVRYEFERAFHDERASGEVGVTRLGELMVAAQRRIWGDALLPDGTDPWFWASKLHFYITETTFYNFPYTFGFLLAMALERRFRQEGPAFLADYERFLRRTGGGTAEEVVREALGQDIRRPEFWAEGILALEEPLGRYEALLAESRRPPS